MKHARSLAQMIGLTLILLLLAAWAGPAPIVTPTATLPAAVSSEAWDGIQAGLSQAEYHFTWHKPGAAYGAPNRAHGWSVAFTAGGVEVTSQIPSPSPSEGEEGGWSWGLSLARYGYRGQLQTITRRPAQTVDANRVEYRHAEGQLVEWYLNDERGLEQGFTLQSPPVPRLPAPLHIEMAFTGNLTASLTDDRQAILFADADGQTILRYGGLYVTDAAGRQLPAHLQISDLRFPMSDRSGRLQAAITIAVDDTGAVYPLIVDPLLTSQVAKLTASDGVPSDFFGSSVSISGDTVVVGAEGDDNWKGSAYVFERNQGGTADNWGQVRKLTASDGAADDNFGSSVAISGDTVIVGAHDDDSSKGAAYVFERNHGGADNWGQTKKLTAGDGAANDYFGHSVAISGDTVVVGAHLDDSHGSAYVFARNQGGADQWGLVKKLTAGDAATGDDFGWSVAISGDTVVVGASYDDVGSNGAQGSVYVFERNQGGADNWGQVKKLTASDGVAVDLFGYSVGISGDTAVIGAYHDDNQGSAYVFERNQGGADNWGQVKKLTASDRATGDRFGWSVAISGDTAVVGAEWGDVGANINQGSAYLFERNQGGADQWGQVRKLTAGDGAAYDLFGWFVAISGSTVVVGADHDDSLRGSAYVFVRSGELWEQEQERTASDGVAGDLFGVSVALSGDTAVVGAHGDDSDRGAAYVFVRNHAGTANNWGQVKKLTASDGVGGDHFGYSVAISGDTVVVGAYGDNVPPFLDVGSAYVFERNQGGADNWGQVKKLTASFGSGWDHFGASVGISGDTVVVGANGDGSSRGAAYIFERNQGGADNWGQVRKLTVSDGAADDELGVSVAISGPTVVVGAHGDDTGKGSAYVFSRNQGGADNWGQVRKLTASDGVGGDYFGRSVAISGDAVVTGAYDDNIVPFLDQGSAYVFERNQGGADNWGQIKKLTASDGLGWDHFGTSVAISGDTIVVGANGDDGSTGSGYLFERNYDPANPGTPSADNWGQVKKLTAGDRATDDEFGISVAISGHTVLVGAHGDDSDTGSAYVFRQVACLDLNSDDVVNTVDIMGVVARWGMTSTDPGWSSLYDLDGDLHIGVVDVMLVAGCWRQHC